MADSDNANPAILDLSNLQPEDGVVVTGFRDYAYVGRGFAAGDVNGDGFIDLVIGAWQEPPYDRRGAVYVVFGTADGIPTGVDLNSLDPSQGFSIRGAEAGHAIGEEIAVADIDGDGDADILIGARGANPGLGNLPYGAVYVVFGGDTPQQPIELSTLTASQGFRMQGAVYNAQLGTAVGSAGDVNADGIEDFILGAHNALSRTGASYVVFGSATGFPLDFDLSTLDGSDGFTLVGEADSRAGYSVASAGDVNGDGIDDLIIGAITGGDQQAGSWAVYGVGASYVVFGSDTGFAASINLADLDGSDGFRVTGGSIGDHVGRRVSAAGDVNGDGIGDVIIGAPLRGNQLGSAYVVLGSRDGFAPDIDIADFDGTDGFRITGEAMYGRVGWSVSSAGDFNGDGLDDLLISTPYDHTIGYGSGAAFIVFGRSQFDADIDLSAIDGTNGLRLHAAASSWFGIAAGAAGDVNGDGFDDIMVGALFDDGGGYNAGAVYLIYGRPTAGASVVETGTSGADDYLGGDADDSLSGAGGDDILNGGLGADSMIGGTGNDTYHVDNLGDTTDETGGDGVDTVISTIDWTLDSGLENLTFTGTANLGGAGNALANVLTGNDGANTLDGGDGADKLYGGLGADDLIGGAGGDLLDGGLGADAMAGGLGDDTYVVDDFGDVVSEAGGGGSDRVRASVGFVLGADFENLQLTGTGNISGTGNSLNNQIDGNSGNNILNGEGGNDIIRGNGGLDDMGGADGNDQLLGGDGNDTLYGGDASDILQGNADDDFLYGGAGIDTLEGGTGLDVLYGENGNDKLLGGDGDDQLFGGADNDQLTGGLGVDRLEGGSGDDTYIVDDNSDTLVENAGGGNDIVRTTIDWTLADHFERLILEGPGDIDGTGNGLVNQITGNGGANVIDGAGGNDTLNGGLGNDILIGGTGGDILIGGGGNDVFLIRQESAFTSAAPAGRAIETDTISDYVIGQDRIDLSDVDAIAGTVGIDDAFSIVSAFDGVAGRMTLTFAGGITTLQLDVDGDRSADYRLRINGDVRGDTAGWAL